LSVPTFIREASPYKATRALVARLFEGIRLSVEQETRAREIISDTIGAQLAVTLRNADGWDRLLELLVARDAALRDLLTSDRDRTIFDRHSAEMRRRQSEVAPPATIPLVLRAGVVPIHGGTLEIVFRADGMPDGAIEDSSWKLVHAFRGDAELLGVIRMSTIADTLERRDQFATYSCTVTRSFGRQPDGAWVALPAV
jgi:hypothetical protein